MRHNYSIFFGNFVWEMFLDGLVLGGALIGVENSEGLFFCKIYAKKIN